MNPEYTFALAVTALLSTGLLILRLRKRRMKIAPALCGLFLSAALGLVFAKVLYVALLFHRVWPRYEWEAFLQFRGAEFSFFGGCAGVLLGMLLSARLFREDARRFMTAFAPCGALMAAGARYAERYLGLLGVGSYTDDPFLARFPFAVSNKYNEWFLAVFMLEALAALAIALVFFLRKKEEKIPGLLAERVIFYLCLAQIFCESLRAQGMKWGFVRVEQVLSAVVLVALLALAGLKIKAGSAWKRFWPLPAALLCIVVIVGVEFALDKTELPPLLLYGVMLLMLAAMAAMECACTRKRLKQAA